MNRPAPKNVLPTSLRTAPLLLRLALLVAAVMALLPATLQAQGYQPIRVSDQSHAVTFPGGLRVSLTAESEWEITDIRILYRLKGSGPWFSGSARLVPSRRVSASFDGIIAPGGYIPPGAVIEYHWEIEDSAGYSLSTAPSDILYTDTRFDWQRTQAGPLTLQYHGRSSSRAARVVAQAAGDLGYVQEMLGLDAVQPMLGIVYNHFDEAAPAFPSQSRTVSRQQVFHGYAFPSQGIFLGVGLDRDLLVHESAHLMFGQKLAGASYPVPAWLEEGFASYVEPGASPRSGRSLAELGPPLAAMNAVSGTPANIRIFYLKSESVVAFLIEEYGTASFRLFLDRLTAGLSTDQALLATYGFDTPGLEVRWAASDRGVAYGSSDGSGRGLDANSLFLTFNAAMLGGLILLVMAAWAVQYALRRLRSRRDEDEWDDLDPDDWDD